MLATRMRKKWEKKQRKEYCKMENDINLLLKVVCKLNFLKLTRMGRKAWFNAK